MSRDEFVEQTTAAALAEKAKLQKHFGRFDMFFYLICTIVGIEALGTVAGYEWEGILLLVIMAVTFFIPYGLLISELGSTFTEEGGPVHLDAHGVRPLPGGHQRGAVLDLEPDLDGRDPDPDRHHGLLDLVHQPRDGELRLLRLRDGVHLVRDVRGDPLVRRRQVDPDHRRHLAAAC